MAIVKNGYTIYIDIIIFFFRLEQVVKNGEQLLEKIQNALADIAQSQLDMQHFQTNNENNKT